MCFSRRGEFHLEDTLTASLSGVRFSAGKEPAAFFDAPASNIRVWACSPLSAEASAGEKGSDPLAHEVEEVRPPYT